MFDMAASLVVTSLLATGLVDKISFLEVTTKKPKYQSIKAAI